MDIPEVLEQKLNRIAKEAGKTTSQFLNLLLDEYSQEINEAKEVDKLYEDFIKSGEKTIPLEYKNKGGKHQ